MTLGIRREIEPGALCAVLDLDDPKVWIKRNFPFEPLLRLVGIDPRLLVRTGEKPFESEGRVAREGLRRRLIERRASSRSSTPRNRAASAAPLRRKTALAPSTPHRRK